MYVIDIFNIGATFESFELLSKFFCNVTLQIQKNIRSLFVIIIGMSKLCHVGLCMCDECPPADLYLRLLSVSSKIRSYELMFLSCHFTSVYRDQFLKNTTFF